MGEPILSASTCISLTQICPSSSEKFYCYKYLRHEASSCCPFTCICENTWPPWNLSKKIKEATVESEERVIHSPLSVDQSLQCSSDICFSLWPGLLQIPNDAPAWKKPASQGFLPVILYQLKLSSFIWKWQHDIKKGLKETQSLKSTFPSFSFWIYKVEWLYMSRITGMI